MQTRRKRKSKIKADLSGICVICKEWYTLPQRRVEFSNPQRFCSKINKWVSETDRCTQWHLSQYVYCTNQSLKSKFFRPVSACATMPNGKSVCKACVIGKIVRHYILREAVFFMSSKEMILSASQELLSVSLLTSEKSETLRQLLERGNVQEVGDYYMGLIEAIPLRQERSIPKEALRIYNALIDGTITFEGDASALYETKMQFVRTR